MVSTHSWHVLFSPLGKDSHFDSYHSDGLVQPPTRKWLKTTWFLNPIASWQDDFPLSKGVILYTSCIGTSCSRFCKKPTVKAVTAKAADLLGRTPLKGGLVVCTKSNQCKHIAIWRAEKLFCRFCNNKGLGGVGGWVYRLFHSTQADSQVWSWKS